MFFLYARIFFLHSSFPFIYFYIRRSVVLKWMTSALEGGNHTLCVSLKRQYENIDLVTWIASVGPKYRYTLYFLASCQEGCYQTFLFFLLIFFIIEILYFGMFHIILQFLCMFMFQISEWHTRFFMFNITQVFRWPRWWEMSKNLKYLLVIHSEKLNTGRMLKRKDK